MIGLLRFSNSILCKKEVLGKNYECEIAGIKTRIYFPQYPQVDDANPQIGMLNPLLAPEIGKCFKDPDDHSFWGEPMSHPDGNSSVNKIVVSVECDKTQTYEIASKLYKEFEKWTYSFITHLMLQTKQNLERNRNESEVAFLQLFEDKNIPNITPLTISIIIPNEASFASESQIKNAILFANSGKELLLEYQMLLSAYGAIQQNQNRRAIMDACSAFELALVNYIDQYCLSKGIPPEILIDKYRSLGERIKLTRKLDTKFPQKDYIKLVVEPRNSLMHNKCVFPTEETTNNLITCVEELLSYFYSSYY